MAPKLCAVAFLMLTALLSCNSSEDKDYIDKSLIPATTENKTVPASDTIPHVETPALVITAQPNTPVTNTTAPVSISPGNATPPVTINSQPTTVATATGMNPPHGQPGHRCDIAVGAPLNSKPMQPAIQPAATITTSQPQLVQQPIAAGMNPPHGQPGHRCDIAVGAPLNSKPAQNANAAQPAITVQKPDSIKNR